MYAVPQLSDHCRSRAAERGLSPTVGFYLDSGIGGVPLSGFCSNPNLQKHGLLVNHDSEELENVSGARVTLCPSELRDDAAAEEAARNGSVAGTAFASSGGEPGTHFCAAQKWSQAPVQRSLEGPRFWPLSVVTTFFQRLVGLALNGRAVLDHCSDSPASSSDDP